MKRPPHKPNYNRVARLENLEERWTPAQFGIPWTEPSAVTLSIAPDGTAAADLRSDLIATLDSQMARGVWRSAIYRAMSKWTEISNLNIGIVGDRGFAFGTPGRSEGDLRMGDIRLGGFRMDESVLAVSIPPGSANGTFAGDIFINTAATFTPQSLEATLIHEIGHAIGLDHSTDTNSVMFSHLNNIRTLAPSDVDAVLALYGSRSADSNEATKTNDTLKDATRIRYSAVSGGYDGSTPVVEWGDLTTNSDVDYFYLPVLAGYSGPVTVKVQTSNLSLVSPKLTALDRDGRVLAEVSSVASVGGDVHLTIDSSLVDERIYFKVEHSRVARFPIGRYGISATFDSLLQPTALSLRRVVRENYEHLSPENLHDLFQRPAESLYELDLHTNDTLATATNLRSAPNTTLYNASVLGALEDAVDIDYYAVRSPSSQSRWVLTATLITASTHGVLPTVQAFDGNGVAMPTEILANGNRSFIIQVAGVRSNRTVNLRVESARGAVGNYRLYTTFAQQSTQLTSFMSGDLPGRSEPVSGKLYVAQTQMFSLALQANGSRGVVTLEIRDSAGNLVELLRARGQSVATTVSRLLPPGEYDIRVSTNFAQSFSLNGMQLTDPLGPVLDSGSLDPQYKDQTGGGYTYPNDVSSITPYLWLLLLV